MNLNVKKLGYWLLIIALGAVVGISVKFFAQPAIAPEDIVEAGHFNLVIDYGNTRGVYENIPFDAGENLFSATQELAGEKSIELSYENYGDLGMLVVSIGGEGGSDSGAYWQYWINGEYAQVGASAYQIQDGDQIEWRFTNAQQ